MNCAWVKSQISLYVYNELDELERVEFEQHLQRCAACAAEVEQERRLHRTLDARERLEPNPNLLASCRIQLTETLEKERQRFGWAPVWEALRMLVRPRFQPALAVLALLLVGFTAGWVASSHRVPVPVLDRVAPADEYNIANISSIHAINSDAKGNLEIVFDTTRRRVLHGSAEDPKVEQLLLYAARNYSNPGIRLDSIGLLKDRAADEEIRGALIAALRADLNAGVRLKALESLKAFSADAQVKQALLDALRADDNPGVRIQAIDQLGKLRDQSTVPLLQRLAASDPNNYVRMRSVSALRDLNASEIF